MAAELRPCSRLCFANLASSSCSSAHVRRDWDIWDTETGSYAQAKLVKAAVTKALAAVKESRPLSLLSGFEQRMGCLGDIAR